MSRCSECDATHDDPCTYALCPRRNPIKNTKHRFPNGSGIVCIGPRATRAAPAQALPSATLAGAACFFAFHAVSNTSVSEQYLVTR